jgi:hypothetical protein
MKKKPQKTMGRPKKADDEKRARYLQVRISDEEKATFDEAAKDSGLELSQWVRNRLLMAARTERARIDKVK